ncbi:MAG: VOC family protein [Pseudomonadota bacterium]
MIAHASLHVSDYARSKAFYIKVLATIGYENNMEVGEAAGFFDGRKTDLWVVKEPVVPTHIAFEAKSREEVEAFYQTALAAGAIDNGPPGYRREYWPGYYAAFVYDSDGHNIEAVWYDHDEAGTTVSNA